MAQGEVWKSACSNSQNFLHLESSNFVYCRLALKILFQVNYFILHSSLQLMQPSLGLTISQFKVL